MTARRAIAAMTMIATVCAVIALTAGAGPARHARSASPFVASVIAIVPTPPATPAPTLTPAFHPTSQPAGRGNSLQQLMDSTLHTLGSRLGAPPHPKAITALRAHVPPASIRGYTCPVTGHNPCHRRAHTVFIATAAVTF